MMAMMKPWGITISLLACCTLPLAVQGWPGPGLNDGDVFPPPQMARTLGGQFVLDPNTFTINVANPSPQTSATLRLNRAIDRYHDLVFDYGPAADASTAECCGQTGTSTNCTCVPLTQLTINVADRDDDSFTRFTNESYLLHVEQTNAGIISVLNATSVYGAMRGLMSFSQNVKFNMTSATYTMFGIEIQDQPTFEYRGVMIDTSRNFVSLETIKMTCDLMENNKMNALHLHLTDDQSWPIEIEGFPKLTQWLAWGNQAYNTDTNATMEHVFTINKTKAMVEYCLDRAVRVIPEVDMPGHNMAQMAYPEYFVVDDNPHNCAENASEACGRGMIDVTTDHGFEFIDGIWKSLIDTFPGGEYHIGGDEVWMPPWSNSTQILNWLDAHKNACPDDAKITCGTLGDVQPYFTRKTIDIIQKYRPDAQIQAWNPGVGSFYGYGNLGTRYPTFTYNNWNGPGVWQGPMADMTSPTGNNASTILSGPFYVYDPDHPDHFDWEQMMHQDILNFTGGNTSKVRGAELTAWGDASKIDSGNLFTLARYMSGISIRLWSPNGTVTETDPITGFNSCNGNDYGICDAIDFHRCTNMMRGLPGGKRARGFGVECSVPYEPQPAKVWYRSPVLPPVPPPGPGPTVSPPNTSSASEIIERLRKQIRRAGLVPVV